jgi:hypothetical protein
MESSRADAERALAIDGAAVKDLTNVTQDAHVLRTARSRIASLLTGGPVTVSK